MEMTETQLRASLRAENARLKDEIVAFRDGLRRILAKFDELLHVEEPSGDDCLHAPDYSTIAEATGAKGSCLVICSRCDRGGYFHFDFAHRATIWWTGPILKRRSGEQKP